MENELKGVKSAMMKDFWIQSIQSVYSVWGKEKEKEVKKENIKKKEEAQASSLIFKILPTKKIGKQTKETKQSKEQSNVEEKLIVFEN